MWAARQVYAKLPPNAKAGQLAGGKRPRLTKGSRRLFVLCYFSPLSKNKTHTLININHKTP